jgi:sporulation protein YlmC with PRC-barrel domain
MTKEATTMDIPVNVDVYCTDGLCGQSTCVLVNPIRKEVTHVVVKEAEAPHDERIVPIEVVLETTPDMIMLQCTRNQLNEMDPFIETEYIREKMPELYGGLLYSGYMGLNTTWIWPYVVPERAERVAVEHKQIPPGELAIRRGTRVDATDGHVGRVDEFLVNPENEHITHLVMREGHLWGQKDVTIPVSAIDHLGEDTVYLKLDKQGIEDLPTIPIRRK